MTDLSMTAGALIEGLPDLVVVVHRDGVVLQWGGGHGVPGLRPSRGLAGQRLEAVWSRPGAGLPRQLARRAIAARTTTASRFDDDGCAYAAPARGRGPERRVCARHAGAA